MSVNESYPVCDNDARCASCGEVRSRNSMAWDGAIFPLCITYKDVPEVAVVNFHMQPDE